MKLPITDWPMSRDFLRSVPVEEVREKYFGQYNMVLGGGAVGTRHDMSGLAVFQHQGITWTKGRLGEVASCENN